MKTSRPDKEFTFFFDLVQRLNSEEAQIRADAQAELRQTPTEDLTAIWQEYWLSKKKADEWMLGSGVIFGIFAFLAITLAKLSFWWIVAFVSLYLCSLMESRSLVKKWQRAIHSLIVAEDVRVIEPLTDILYENGVPEALMRLLPKLQLSDAAWLSGRSRNRIRGAIFSDRTEFAEACLRGLTAVGDRDTLVSVALLIMRDAPTAHDQHLREVARECLPHLQENAFGNRVEEIPALIECLPAAPALTTGMVTSRQYIAVLGLAHLLPRLTPADAHLLTPESRHRLCANLGGLNLKEDFVTISRLGADFSLAVIGALTRFGGKESLHALERCAEGKYSLWQLSPQDERRGQLAASLALPVVEARVAAERESDTLLRGSQAPEPAAETLLRPASASAPETEPQQLLRATNTPFHE